MVLRHRDVAQLGSALPWGGRGRQFKSDRSDQFKTTRQNLVFSFVKMKLLNVYCSIHIC